MAMTTAICWGAFIIVLFRIDPNSAGSVGLLLFFVALFFAIWGSFSMLGFFIRYLFIKDTVLFRHVGISLRQAFWFAILICLSLFLVTQELLAWWMSILLVIGLSVLEGFFLSRAHEDRHRQKRQLNKKPI